MHHVVKAVFQILPIHHQTPPVTAASSECSHAWLQHDKIKMSGIYESNVDQKNFATLS